MTTELQNFALTTSWLDQTAGDTSATFTGDSIVNHTYTINGWCEPWYYTPWTTIYRDAEITLKMSEVERLRMAAREDKKLKKILEKFTPYIKVVVDFD